VPAARLRCHASIIWRCFNERKSWGVVEAATGFPLSRSLVFEEVDMLAPRHWLITRMLPGLFGGLLGTLGVAAGSKLPIPCAPNACGPTGPSKFVTSGAATATATANALTVQQTSNTAILNWSSFDIGPSGSVTFKQPGSTSIALNRIFENSPAQIFGNLTANGQVYLINLNGFLFGPTAKVNVGSLLVSSLPLQLTDATFANGILSPLQNGDSPVFNATCATSSASCPVVDPLAPGGRTSVLGANGQPVLDADGRPLPVQVIVQQGAQINAADQGRVLLAGQNVTNGGAITSPDGQVILAAGSKVYLQASTDPGLRGLVVEVDGTPPTSGTTASSGTPAAPGNTAWNQLTGLLSAPRGNVWMVGLAVNQDGRISSTTSVSANGSIHLEAAGSPTFGGTGAAQTVSSSQGGALTIGAQSELQILPDTSSGTAVAAQTQLPSTVTLLGEQVVLQGGSIDAPGASLTAIAAANPSAAAAPGKAANSVTGVTGTRDSDARLRIDPGTNIDLAGSSSTLPVTANLVSAQLRSSELADDPTQRNGALHGDTVYFDARDGSPPIANLSGEIAGVTQTIAQRTAAGGNAIFQSEGDAVFASGATLNVSGGTTTYAGGTFETSYLVGANGQLYPIATANPLLTYVGVINPTFTQTFNTWGVQNVVPTPGLSSYQPGYVQGAPAGSVQFAAPTMVLQGTLQGSAVNGIYQRTPSTAVAGGTLTIGIPAGVQQTGTLDYLTPSIAFTTAPTPIVVSDEASLPGPLTLQIPTSYLTSSGFTATKIFGNSEVELPANTPLSLPPGSTFQVNAARVDILSGINDAGGALSFQNQLTVGVVPTDTNDPASPQRAGVFIGDGVTLDVRGIWTNDFYAAGTVASGTSPTWQNGGSISLGTDSDGALLALGNNVSLRASGGAWMQANGTIVPGTGGNVTLNGGAPAGGLDVGSNLSVDGFGVNGAAGGSFSLTAPRVEIGTAPSTQSGWTLQQSVDDSDSSMPGGVFHVYSNLFSNYGFQKLDLSASGLVAPFAPTTSVMTLDAGSSIVGSVRTLELPQNAVLRPSATTLDSIASVTLLPAYLQSAESITLSALPSSDTTGPIAGGPATTVGDVTIGTGASITTAEGGSISLQSVDSIFDYGTLRAPAGKVTLESLTPGNNYIDDDLGFLADQRVEVGPTAVIDVSGVFVPQPSTAALSLGTIYGGGTVNLFADRGALITDPGSLISVTGTSAALDILQPNGAYGHEIAASTGGAIAVRSGEAISLLGNVEAAAGSGGTSGPAAAGSLDVELTRSESWWSVATPQANATFNQSPLTLELRATVPSDSGASLSDGNQALIGAAQLAQSGLDSVRLEAGGTVALANSFTLNLGRSFEIDAPAITARAGANTTVSAPFVELDNHLQTSQITPPNLQTATAGTGTLTFKAGEMDLLGTMVFQGASQVRLSSTGDLQLLGEASSAGATTLTGGLTVVGNLGLDAARIYPATETTFNVIADKNAQTGAPGAVTIGQTSASPGTPLSAGGQLSIEADSIDSTGSLYAPFGSIALSGTSSVTLGNGSLTSVSGDGLTIPFGATQYGGEQWTYTFLNLPQVISSIPARTVNLDAPQVTITKQATINLKGGGDLSAYEWVPGPGGSTDALAPSSVTGPVVAGVPGLYAILPSTRGQAAPVDALDTDPSILPGESVYLSGGGGLAAGIYPLLPARYALLPGAFLVQVVSSDQSTTPGPLGALANGTPVVAGYLSFGETGLHQTPGYTGFAVYPGSYGTQLAAYDVSLASSFFSAAATAAGEPRPTLPADAGSLSISVGKALNAAGQVLTAAASGGLNAPIEISATDLVVGTATGTVPADAVSISAAVLTGWQPGSLILGGTETVVPPGAASTGGSGSSTSGSATIDVQANSVIIGRGTLTADQIVVVANQSIDVQGGATLQSTSAATGATPAVAPVQQLVTPTLAGSNPGLLAVSDLNWLIPQRASGSSGANAGTVAIDSGATIASRGSLTVDGVGGTTLNGSLKGPGAEWSLGSSSIALGPKAKTTDSLSIDGGILAALDTASAVRLASTGSIDLFSPITLGVNAAGAPTLNSLTLEASSINNLTGAGISGATASLFGAKTLTLQGAGPSSAVPVATAGPTGSTLSLVADELDLGTNTLAVNGFAATLATVHGAVIGQGNGSVLFGGNLTMTAGEITAAAGADTSIGATGAIAIAPTTVKGTLPQPLGGSLTVTGASLDISGKVTAAAGAVTLAALNDLTVDKGATIGAPGSVVTIENQTASAPGGSVSLTAGGNLTLSAGSTVDVSGAGSAAAGELTLDAGGTSSIAAKLLGVGGKDAAGGSFTLDTGSLVAPAGGSANALTQLAASLGSSTAGAGGFNQLIDLRVHSGDLVLDGASSLTANAVTLTSDTGSIRIDGRISAPSGALRGQLALFGGTGVELAAGGVLRTDGTGASGLGGKIEIGAGELLAGTTGELDHYNNGSIALDAGSVISTAGAGGAGTLLLRAPALTASDDVAITALASNTSAVGQIIVEPVLPFNTASGAFSSATAPTVTDFMNLGTTIGNYMTAAVPNITGRLAQGSGAPLVVQAGVEIIAPGTLVLPTLDLSPSNVVYPGIAPGTSLSNPGTLSWQFGGQPVDLTVRAAGGIQVSGTISDGFYMQTVSDSNGGNPVTQPTLLYGPSASIRLVAGADLSSANPLAVVSPTGGSAASPLDLTIDAGAYVRTGTGDIDLVAARNIVLAGPGSGAYTAGLPAIEPNATAAIPYPSVDPNVGTTISASSPTTGVGYDTNGNPVTYGVFVSDTSLLTSLPTGGGSLTVRAGGDIDNPSMTSAGAPTLWQLRTNRTSLTTPQLGVNLAGFNWNFGTLGGGDLNIAAGGSAINVSAAAADSVLAQPIGAAPVYERSGGLSFKAGGDIGSAQIFLADGQGAVTAGGALSTTLNSSQAGQPNVGSAFYLQSASLEVTTRLGSVLEGVFNPTALAQPIPQGESSVALGGTFFTYAANGVFSLQSVAGPVTLGTSSSAESTVLGVSLLQANASSGTLGTVPASLTLQSLTGDINFEAAIGTLTLYPSPVGQLDLIAAQDIVRTGQGNLIMSDAAPESVTTLTNGLGTTSLATTNFSGDIHVSDPNPALVTAGGNIEGLSLAIPKAAQFVAGQDIVDLTYIGQNLDPSDETLIFAGRDFTYTNEYANNGISVGGPGLLDILAGRNITLGFSPGVVTTGNLANANLPTAQGADLTMYTGLGSNPDYLEYLKQVIEPSANYQTELVNYVETLQGSAGLSVAAAETAFQDLSTEQQRPLIDEVFFNELELSGQAANNVPGAGFTQGYNSIDTLFPGSRSGTAGASTMAYAGALTLQFSRIYTLSGGNITLVVPGGNIDVGLANPPSTLNARAPSSLGIVTEESGNIDIYAKGDVNVNSSRIFTLGGGNILIWSDEGSIDAGLGAKTSISAPPPSILIASDGTVSIDFSGAATGSGIRTIETEPTTPAGNVDLIAPVGTVNAGDAGIGASGNINIAARSVIGVSNITFGGTATGVPAQVSSVGASLSGASSAAGGASNAATNAVASETAAKESVAPLAQTALSWLDVFVTGLGEENCKPDDIECLKRQRTATH
jgi:filamentous hemagglutinin